MDEAKIIDSYERGLTVMQVASLVGAGYHPVRKVLKKHGKLRSRGRRKKVVQDISRAIARTMGVNA